MKETSNFYHFTTHWQVEATPEEVFQILDDVEELPRWWPAVYLDLRILKPGDPDGKGKEVELYTKGWLPYSLRWKFKRIEKIFPYTLALEAFGDLKGYGVWNIRAIDNSEFCRLTYDWKVLADKPILKYLSFLLKPLFSANHHWAMRKGEESLKLEILRKRAKTEEERSKIPVPPPPTFPHNLMNNKIF